MATVNNEDLQKQKNDPVIYNDKGHVTHVPDWAYSDM